MIPKILCVLFMGLIASLGFAQEASTLAVPAQDAGKGADMSERQLDLEVRQIVMERKIRELEAQVKQQQDVNSGSSEANAVYRMQPRHIEVLKKETPQPIRNKQIPPYPIYPVLPLQNNNAPIPQR